MNRVLRHALGWLSLLVGLAGLVLPILQGWFFIAVGAVLLAPDVPIFARLVAWIERRFPHLRGAIRRWRRKLAPRRP